MKAIFRIIDYVKISLFIIVFIPILVSNINLHRPQFYSIKEDNKIIKKQLDYLKWSFQNGGALKMQDLYPEGAFFFYSLYSLSWIEYANRLGPNGTDSEYALKQARLGITKMEGEFSRFPYLENISPNYGIFMTGWVNWTKGVYDFVARSQSSKEYFEADIKVGSENIALAYKQGLSHYLESYSGMAWPSDNIVAIASLKLHDRLYRPKHESLIDSLRICIKGSLDPHTGMFPYESNYLDGTPIEGPRGNSQAVIIRFLAEFDKELAEDQYRLYHKTFPKNILGLRFTREVPEGVYGSGNVDSGPIVFDIGFASTIVAQIPYRMFGDSEGVDLVLSSINATGFPFTYSERTKYVGGQMPIADAFLVWGSMARPYTETYQSVVLSNPSFFWKLEFHFYSLLAVTALLALFDIGKFRSAIWGAMKSRNQP